MYLLIILQNTCSFCNLLLPLNLFASFLLLLCVAHFHPSTYGIIFFLFIKCFSFSLSCYHFLSFGFRFLSFSPSSFALESFPPLLLVSVLSSCLHSFLLFFLSRVILPISCPFPFHLSLLSCSYSFYPNRLPFVFLSFTNGHSLT